jgi:glycosyltransferase involved in cell wall biosynthesis
MQAKDVTLTIGIPTFNRRDAVIQRLKELQSADLPENVSVLIIDNNSEDGTYEALVECVEDRRHQILRNEKNFGYAGNFLELLDQCRSEYILFMSDEDELITDNLHELLLFLAVYKPDFVSPQVKINGCIYRGESKTCGMTPLDFKRASGYLSGLVFQTQASQRYSRVIRTFLNLNAAAYTYPQVLLASMLLAGGTGYWFSEVVAEKREQLHSHIANPDGEKYYYLVGRFQQSLGFLDFFEAIHDDSLGGINSQAAIRNLGKMRQVVEMGIVQNLRSGLAHQRPELVPIFDQACLRVAAHQFFVLRFLSKLILGVRYPKKIVPYLIKKIR